MNLVEGLNKELDRCRELVELYKAIGPAGTLGRMSIEASIKEGKEAMESGDTVRMVRAYARLEEHE